LACPRRRFGFCHQLDFVSAGAGTGSQQRVFAVRRERRFLRRARASWRHELKSAASTTCDLQFSQIGISCSRAASRAKHKSALYARYSPFAFAHGHIQMCTARCVHGLRLATARDHTIAFLLVLPRPVRAV
jgi:hypothetical protein